MRWFALAVLVVLGGFFLLVFLVGNASGTHSVGDLAPTSQGSHDNLLAPASVCPTTAGDQMLCLVNYARGKLGLQPLFRKPELVASANAKADRMIACRSWSHHPCGDQLGNYAENLSFGSTVRGTFNAWMHSPYGHRFPITSSRFRYWGSAYRYGPQTLCTETTPTQPTRRCYTAYRLWVAQFS